jgi:hypothetical protein
MSKTLVAGWLTDGPGRLERQRVRAGAAVKETTAAASGRRERERESERARERNGEMDALRKQASRFKEQVAKQQQVRIPRPILPFHYLAAVLFFC